MLWPDYQGFWYYVVGKYWLFTFFSNCRERGARALEERLASEMLAAGAREESKKDAAENVWIPQDSKLSNTDFQEEMFYPFSDLRDCALFMALIRFLDSGVQFCHVFALDYGFWFRALWIPCSWYIRVQQRISNYFVTFVVFYCYQKGLWKLILFISFFINFFNLS